MKSRLIVIVLSLVLAAAATLGAAIYITKLKSSVVEGQKLVEVVVTQKPVSTGSSVTELFASGAVKVEKVPKQYVAESAITSIKDHADRVLATDLAKGEQLTENRFKTLNETGLAHKIPESMVAVSIAIDEVTGLGGRLQPGDNVDIIATFSPGPNNEDVTKTMLQKIQILATSDSGTGDPKADGFDKTQQSGGKKTVTLAVYPGYAEKLVYAAEKGHIWLTLRRGENTEAVATSGQTIQTVFK